MQVYAVESEHADGRAVRAKALHVPILDCSTPLRASPGAEDANHDRASTHMVSIVSITAVPPDLNRGDPLFSVEQSYLKLLRVISKIFLQCEGGIGSKNVVVSAIRSTSKTQTPTGEMEMAGGGAVPAPSEAEGASEPDVDESVLFVFGEASALADSFQVPCQILAHQPSALQLATSEAACCGAMHRSLMLDCTPGADAGCARDFAGSKRVASCHVCCANMLPRLLPAATQAASRQALCANAGGSAASDRVKSPH